MCGSISAAEFRDALGRPVSLAISPRRIIPLAPSLTEILYFLGLGAKIVGVTEFSYYPPEALKKPVVGSYINLNVEKIISLKPDLVIATADGNPPGSIALLERAQIKVFVVNPRKVQEVIETITTLGLVCGAEERARRSAQALRARVKAVEGKVRGRPKPLVFLQINLQPIMSVNKNTLHDHLIRLAGGDNLAKEAPVTYPKISLEEVLIRRPEVILISSMDQNGRFEEALKEWRRWPGIPAVKGGRIHLIDSDLIDRPSPRMVDGLERMARLIHPEAF